jgi:serine/threonine-protein kinase
MTTGRRRFRIIKEIAEGGFGKVYLAEQISSDGFSRIVAVKLLHAKWSSHDEIVMRTRDEARLLGLIRHQHIVKVEDLTSIDGKCAIVMEYLEGVDLKWMSHFFKERGEPFPRAALFEIILACASALDAAYNGRPLQGGDPLRVIHRDIKPSNVFATVAGAVKVLDFGTARANFEQREAKTQALAFGSQGYMAPERMLGEEDTPAADVFSLGITLYELLTQESFGRIPPRPAKFNQKVADRIADMQLEGDAEWCERIRDTLASMLAYAPADRPIAGDLVDVFEGLAQDANDVPLRRFCRLLVAEAKESLPEVDTGDPLCGCVVDEDTSIGFVRGTQAPMGSTPGIEAVEPMVVPETTSDLSVEAPEAAVAAGLPDNLDDGDTIRYEEASVPEAKNDNASLLKGLLAGGAALVVLSGLGLGAAAWFLFGGSSEAPAPTAPPVAEVVKEAPAQEKAPGTIVGTDERSDAPKVATTVRSDATAPGSFVISNRDGFKAEWTGVGSFELGGLVADRYSTKVTLSDGTKVRGKAFSVEEGASACTFDFDLESKDWKADCS